MLSRKRSCSRQIRGSRGVAGTADSGGVFEGVVAWGSGCFAARRRGGLLESHWSLRAPRACGDGPS